ncbi:hypothetical protein GCM10009530_75070 [Microbispora corallina]|uniref:Uncharacterized protein n=2 Tax=Microbispora corallina TaxID=83302 RepID=A0ABQ4GBL7_9ACTN|nr:hypothetical protein Mco01_74060 [Microbispora corallina]
MLQASPQLLKLRPLIDAAITEPHLSQLFPYTSMITLRFSRCTGYPYTRDLPWARPIDEGRYQVIGPDRKELGVADGPGSAALIADALPSDCGPAVAGTAYSLRDQLRDDTPGRP